MPALRTRVLATAVLLAAIGCSDATGTNSLISTQGSAANVADPALYTRLSPLPLRVRRGSPAFALASATTSTACSNILVYDNNSISAHARHAVTGMGLTFMHAVSGDFDTKLTSQTWDLVIMDLPSNEPSGSWQTSLVNHIQGGGRAIHTHWNSGTLTLGLQGAFEISTPVEHATQSFYQWNSHSLFTSPNAVSSAFDVWADVWATNGFLVQPTGSAVAAAGFTTSPTAGQAAIVIGNDGKTVFNGFLFDDYDPADKDADGQKDIQELIQNEVELVCGGSGEVGETTQEVPAGEAATITVQENGEPVAGVDIPEGTFGEDVTVTVRFEELAPGEVCHAFLIGQIGRCLEITATTATGEKARILRDVRVGLCLPEQLHLEIFKFEMRDGRTIPLEQTNVDDLIDCDGFQISSAAPRNWLEGLAMGLSKRVGRWIAPKTLYAADRGFGGIIHFDDGLDVGFSFFSWASPIQISHSLLASNVLNSGNDAVAVRGTFDLSAKDFEPFLGEAGFDPSAHAVTVAVGKHVHTIPPSSFRFSRLLGRYVYVNRSSSTGITAMEIHPGDGTFSVGVTLPTMGALPQYVPFTLQIGHRTRGAGLLCGTSGACTRQH